jgi:hypothetical protein
MQAHYGIYWNPNIGCNALGRMTRLGMPVFRPDALISRTGKEPRLNPRHQRAVKHPK